MKTVLWAQSEDSLIKDTFVIDGIVSQESSTPEEVYAFHELTVASNRLLLSPVASKNLSEKMGLSSQANCAIKDSSYYIQGCFVEKDNIGRPMPYRFLTKECESFEEAVKRLEDYSTIINRQCKKDDLDILKDLLDRHKSKGFSGVKWVSSLKKKYNSVRPATVCVVVFFILILLLIIWLLMK